MEGESGEQVGGELESVTSSAGHEQGVLSKAGGMRQEVDSRDEVMHKQI